MVLSAGALAVLALATLAQAHTLMIYGLGAEDVARLESPFALSIASQSHRGPGFLYGPYREGNHGVLVHAPLFYRVAGVVGAVIQKCGAELSAASLAAGRLVSFLSFALVLAACAALARQPADGGPARNRAAWLAVGLIVAAPVPGILWVMARPDALALAFQTWGTVLLLRELERMGRERPPRTIVLVAAYAAFALGVCTRQNNLVTPMVGSALLLIAVLKRRIELGPAALAHLAGAAIVVVYLAAEQAITNGQMFESAFRLPGGPFRSILLGSWPHVAATFAIVAKKLAGFIVLGVVLALVTRPGPDDRLDGILLIYSAAEFFAQAPLYYYNRGGSDNYTAQIVIFACIWMGRRLDRALDVRAQRTKASGLTPSRSFSIAISMSLSLVFLGVTAVAVRNVQFHELARRTRAEDRAVVRALLARPPFVGRNAESIYFIDRADLNRLHGNRALIHDEFVYFAFERAGAAEPRSTWLEPALRGGPVEIVVAPDERTDLTESGPSLPELGYARMSTTGSYRVWERQP